MNDKRVMVRYADSVPPGSKDFYATWVDTVMHSGEGISAILVLDCGRIEAHNHGRVHVMENVE